MKILIIVFCEKELNSIKVRDHCHLTVNCISPAHQKCNNIITQKQRNFICFAFHFFSKHDCHLFLKKNLTKRMKKDNVKFVIINKTNDEYNSIT